MAISTATVDQAAGAAQTPLKVRLARAERRSKLRAAMLVLPLFAFLVVTFVVPIGTMLFRSVENSEIIQNLPRTVEAIGAWDGTGVPDEPVFAALFEDLKTGREARTIGRVATRLNYEYSGARSLITRSARRVGRVEEGPYKEALIDADERWGDPALWRVISREARAYTPSYYLAALDFTYNDQGEVVRVEDERRVYVGLFWRTLWLSGVITGLTILLGYPVAFLLANLPLRYSNLLMIFVLLPFWTSLLVRTTTWIAMLQTQGVLNDILVGIGLISDSGRLQMIYNQTGTIIAMTHILLPFMILPLYSVMRGISPSYVRAARSLGASQFTAFTRVYFPQTIAGLGAGGIIVFILSIGYYITPALVGGESGRFITNFIAYHMNTSLNWGLAAAIGSILLAIVLALYLLYSKLVGVENMKLG